jgi:hypothetical protein
MAGNDQSNNSAIAQYPSQNSSQTQYFSLAQHRSQTINRRLPNPALKPNPFTTYRDPETGRWMVVKSAAA